MWEYKKNYIEQPDKPRKYFDFDYLFKKILNICEDKAEERIDEVAGWKIKLENHNMFKSLLSNHMDTVACKYSDFYVEDATLDLFLFAIRNENDIFIKHSLKEVIFTVKMIANVEVVEEILKNLEKGRKIELCLNILVYTDFSRWRQPEVKRLIDVFDSFVNGNDESNPILVTSNTSMAFAHCCECLKKIIGSVRIFKRTSQQLCERIENLASKIVDNLHDELIEQTFLDRDFKDRTLFQVITSNNLHSFISSGKVNFLLDSVWEGMHMTD